MYLGIDFDGVITDPAQLKAEWVRVNCGVELQPNQTVKDEATKIIGPEKYRAMIDDVYAGSWFLRNTVRPEAIAIMGRLIWEGHRPFIITSRRDNELECAKQLVEIHQVPYSDVRNTNEQSKETVCRELGIQIFLDDSQSKLRDLRGIPGITLVFFNLYGEMPDEGIIAVSSWAEFHRLVKKFKR